MKKITNWRKATVADAEADGLLKEATKIYTLCYHMDNNKKNDIKGDDKERLVNFFNWHIKNKVPIVMHNGIGYDVPLMEKMLDIDLSELMVIDTLILSWYLNFDRERHGLEFFFEDYGVEKPKIDDWEDLDYPTVLERCTSDVSINKALWEDLKSRLIDMYSRAKAYIDAGSVGGKRLKGEVLHIDSLKGLDVDRHIDNILTFLMFKMDVARLKEKTKFYADKPYMEETLKTLESILEVAKAELEGVMPRVPNYSKRMKPKVYQKKDKTLSVSGQRWEDNLKLVNAADDLGNQLVIWNQDSPDEMQVLSKLEPPNIGSPKQIKDFLFSKGWQPKTFKFVKDKEKTKVWADSGFKKELKPEVRMVPQVSVSTDDGKELCNSVLELAEEIPEIRVYAEYNMVKHRRDLIKGFLESIDDEGYLVAGVGGLTNTFREKHRGLVNLPGVDKPYGKEIRGSLICKKGEVLVGSDKSSLEDRWKHHFMMPHDPDYVNTMLEPDYDPHLQMCITAGLITEEDSEAYKKGDKTEGVSKARKIGKCVNYASVYLAGPETIARAADVPKSQGKVLHKAYWELNWSVKAIAEEQCVIEDSKGNSWLVNPINGFCYSLRKQSDRFSTLCQGTGSFSFDMWVSNYLNLLESRFGVRRLAATFHDELVHAFKDTEKNRESVKSMLQEALDGVNEKYGLRRELGIDIQFGYRYSDIH